MAGDIFIGQPGWRSHMTRLINGMRFDSYILLVRDITFPNGVKGTHTIGGRTFVLDVIAISDTEIRMRERTGLRTEFHGFIVPEVFPKIVVAGVFTIPGSPLKARKGSKKRSAAAGQNDGTWVGTKP